MITINQVATPNILSQEYSGATSLQEYISFWCFYTRDLWLYLNEAKPAYLHESNKHNIT